MISALSVEKDVERRSSFLSTDRRSSVDRRSSFLSVTPKSSTHENGSKVSIAGTQISDQMAPPIKEKNIVSSSGGQLFLSIIGAILSASACIFLAFFSSEAKAKIWAASSAFCCFLFVLLAVAIVRRNARQQKEALGRIRRAAMQGSCARKSTKTAQRCSPDAKPAPIVSTPTATIIPIHAEEEPLRGHPPRPPHHGGKKHHDAANNV